MNFFSKKNKMSYRIKMKNKTIKSSTTNCVVLITQKKNKLFFFSLCSHYYLTFNSYFILKIEKKRNSDANLFPYKYDNIFLKY